MSTPLAHAEASILVVDDEHDNLHILRHQLCAGGYRTVTAMSDPFEALRLFATQTFDLVLLDLFMPALDGFAVMEAIRCLGVEKQCPVLVLTARHDRAIRLRALREGASDFLTKPFVEEELLCRLNNLLSMHLATKHLHTLNRHLDQLVGTRTAELKKRNQQLRRSQLDALHRLALAAEFRDNETGTHVMRMSHYAHCIGRRIGLSDAEATMLLHCAPMHDIGKVGIPDRILLKPGKLEAAEWHTMQQHTLIGAQILADSRSPYIEASRLIALTHHERWDGTGYPHGLRGEQIAVFGRITMVADVFDALTSVRPYKHAWPVKRAVETIQEGEGSQFDPRIVSAFIDVLPEILIIKDQHQESTTP